MEGGWIKIHQKLLKWEWFDIPGMVSLWVYILLSANWEDKEWHGIPVPRGSMITSLSSISSATGLSVKQVRNCLDRLKRTNEVAIKTANRFTMITVCKYECYQVVEDGKGQAKGQAEGQTEGKQRATPKDIKTIYNIPGNNAPAYAREDWRFISSVRRSTLNNDSNRIAEHKRSLFRQEVDTLAPELGMTSQQAEAFCRWWTETSPGSEKIRAEFEIAFDTRSRMQNWIERDRPRTSTAKPAKSRMDQYEEDMRFINDFFNGQQQDTTADEQ